MTAVDRALERKIAVVGLGYVGLPVVLAFARRFRGVVGYDVDGTRVAELRSGTDRNGEIDGAVLAQTEATFTADSGRLADADFFVVAVPTPIDRDRRPDLSALRQASEVVGDALAPGDIVVFESTVYPGVTETICRPILEQRSRLRSGRDFGLGYSPERINPGDREHSFESVTKVVSASDSSTLEAIAAVYQSVVRAGVHRAPTIEVAEAAKIIENTQRDLNVALMNECALIFDKLGISTRDVLAAAQTKWNFLRFSPGLVGGHCIGVDPYYLTERAVQVGYDPQVILAGRRINDGMGAHIAERTCALLSERGTEIAGARVVVLGLAFKENVSDMRNSQAPAIVGQLADRGAHCMVCDPLVDPATAREAYGLELVDFNQLSQLDAAIVAVPHRQFCDRPIDDLLAALKPTGGLIVDVRSRLDRARVVPPHQYWSL